MSDFLGRAVGLLATMRGDASDPAAILRVMAFAGSGTRPEFLQHHLARAWGLGEPGQDAIRRALVLFADHELSTSAFAVRVVASTGARLAEAVIAGLAALSGPRHGGATERVRALFEGAARLGGAKRLADAMRPEGSLIGFQHPLYPNGDPRARALIDRLPLRAGDARILDDLAAAGPALDRRRARCSSAASACRRSGVHPLRRRPDRRMAGPRPGAAGARHLIRPRARYVEEPAR